MGQVPASWRMCVLVTKVIGCKKRSAAVGKNALACGRERCGNRHQPWNKAPRTSLRFPMVLVFLLWMSLVLGGAAGGLWLVEALRGNWLRLARVRAPLRRPVWRSDWGVPYPSIEGSRFLYRQRQLVARAGSASRFLAHSSRNLVPIPPFRLPWPLPTKAPEARKRFTCQRHRENDPE